MQSLASVAAGLVLQVLLVRSRRSFSYVHLPILGVLSAVGVLGGLWNASGWSAAEDALGTVFLSSVSAAIILGTLLIHEKRRQSERRRISGTARRGLPGQAIELAAARDAAGGGQPGEERIPANMSHEIRTPMNGIIGMTELVMDSGLDESSANIALTVKDSGEALWKSSTTSSTSRNRGGQGRPRPHRLFHCRPREIVRLWRQSARKGLSLAPDRAGARGRSRGDADRLRQFLSTWWKTPSSLPSMGRSF